MRYALIDNILFEANPELSGLCPGCRQPVTAVCGERRIWHWRHRTKKVCDRWWEPETEWHRKWKNNFPNEWQEIFMPDKETGEKHMADVRTSHGLVIEFQHSRIEPEERKARERFYDNMVWVVDGTRLKRDYPRFQKGRVNFRALNKAGFFCLHFVEECFPSDWLESSVPVIFDFQGTGSENSEDVFKNTLWCLLPGRAENNSIVIGISRNDFITTASNRAHLLPAKEIVSAVAENIKNQRKAEMAAHSGLLLQRAYQQRTRRPYRRRFVRL